MTSMALANGRRRPVPGLARLAALVAAGTLLSACGSTQSAPGRVSAAGRSTDSAVAASVPLTPQLCALVSPDRRVTLPTDRHYTGVAWCSAAARGAVSTPPPPRVVHGEVSALIDALRAPAPPRTRVPSAGCPLIAPPTFWLLDDAGRAFLPRVPTDSCHQPSAGVTAALTALFS